MKYKTYDSGIYGIFYNDTCLYIGASSNILSRYAHHLYQLNNKTHPNSQLQEISDQVGLDNLLFYPIFFCEQSNLFIYEKKYITIMAPVCNYRKGVMVSDFKDSEMSQKSLIYQCIKDNYSEKWITLSQAMSKIKEVLGQSPTSKEVGSSLRKSGVVVKRVGIERKVMYFIK